MSKNGFTLVEVILAIAIIGIMAISFLPVITFAYTNIIKSQDFTEALLDDQKQIENEIENLRDTDPPDPTNPNNIVEIYGKEIVGHNISKSTTSSGVVNVFLPKRKVTHDIPVIKSPPVIKVRQNNSNVNPQPDEIDLMNDIYSLFVDEIEITDGTDDYHLMNVYRWYLSSEMDKSQVSGTNPNEYFILKEWNEAKGILEFKNSENLKYIPNIKLKYNQLIFKEAKDSIPFNVEEYINSFGNRFVRYGVTPFSLIGRVGKEELSNPIYITAPRLNIDKAEFSDSNKVKIYFKEEIDEDIDMSNIKLNEILGIPSSVYRDSYNHKILILEFNDLDNSGEIGNNKLLRGAVKSKTYGSISIWKENIMEGEFNISLQP